MKFYFEDGFRSQDRPLLSGHARRLRQSPARSRGGKRRGSARGNLGRESANFATTKCGCAFRGKTWNVARVRAQYVIDASGRNSVIGSHFKLKKNYDHLQKISIFAHYDGVVREEGRDGTLTRMVRAIDRWFWLIPLTPERTSIGVVLDAAVFKKAKLSPEEFLEQAIAEQPLLRQRDANRAERAGPVSVAADFSYRNTQLTGDRWMLAGRRGRLYRSGFQQRRFSRRARRRAMRRYLARGARSPDESDVVFSRVTGARSTRRWMFICAS